MHRTIKAVAFVATAFYFAISAGYFAPAQELPKHLAADPNVAVLNKLFGQWNSHELDLPSKSQLKPLFNRRLDEIVREHKYAYQDSHWMNAMLKQFDELPEQVKPEKTLNPQAQMVLTLLFLKDKGEFETRISPARTREELSLPLFLVLGWAQAITMKNKAPNIGTEAIITTVLDWWTTIWPFCG